MSSSIPSWQILTAHAQPFRGARDLAFCLKVPLDSLLIWASSRGSGETALMRRLAWTFTARIGDKYKIRLTRSTWKYVDEQRLTIINPWIGPWIPNIILMVSVCSFKTCMSPLTTTGNCTTCFKVLYYCHLPREMAFIFISFWKLLNTAPPLPSKLSGAILIAGSRTTQPTVWLVLGITEYRWHTPSNGKNLLARTTRGAFNNEPANGRDPMVQENFKIKEIIFYIRKTTSTKCYSSLK